MTMFGASSQAYLFDVLLFLWTLRFVPRLIVISTDDAQPRRWDSLSEAIVEAQEALEDYQQELHHQQHGVSELTLLRGRPDRSGSEGERCLVGLAVCGEGLQVSVVVLTSKPHSCVHRPFPSAG